MNSDQARALVFCMGSGLEILICSRIVWEVNAKLKQQGSRPITRKEYGFRFFDQILREHERLFPHSSKRTWFVLILAFSVIWFMAADLFF